MKLSRLLVMCLAMIAAASFADDKDGKLLGPTDSLQPVPGTGVLLLSFNISSEMKNVRFSPFEKRRVVFKHSTVPQGAHLYIWRVPAGKYCLEMFYTGRVRIEPDPDDMLCFSVIENAINYPGTLGFSAQTSLGNNQFWAGGAQMYYSTQAKLLQDLLKESRPELFATGYAWHFGSVDAEDKDAENLRLLEKDAHDRGYVAAMIGSSDPEGPVGLRYRGDDYRKGKGAIKKDPAKALELYRRSADLGDARAAALVCEQLDLGLGAPEDPVQAVGFCRMAAERGDLLGTWYLARLYARGRGGLQPDAAIQAALMAKATNEAELGRIIVYESWEMSDSSGKYPDGAEALRIGHGWLEKAATRESKQDAAFALGAWYAYGVAGSPDGAKAAQYYELAAQLGSSLAQGRLAYLYWRGDKVPRDLAKARDRFELYAKTRPVRENEFAWFLATVDDPAIRNGKRAVAIQLKMLEKVKETPAYVDTLAAAYAAAGDFAKAVETQTRAIEMLRKAGRPQTDVDDYGSRLDLYKAGKPYITAEP